MACGPFPSPRWRKSTRNLHMRAPSLPDDGPHSRLRRHGAAGGPAGQATSALTLQRSSATSRAGFRSGRRSSHHGAFGKGAVFTAKTRHTPSSRAMRKKFVGRWFQAPPGSDANVQLT